MGKKAIKNFISLFLLKKLDFHSLTKLSKMKHIFLSALIFVCVFAQNPPNPPSCPDLQWYDRGWMKGYTSLEGMPLFDEFYHNCEPPSQIAMYKNDCLVVNAYCVNQDFGYYTEHTYFPIFETAHTILMLGILHQYEQGFFDWEDKISSYWPAFGANGKENITFDDFVSGSSGLTHFDNPGMWVHAEGFGNRTGAEEMIVDQAPTWEPKSHYQSPYQMWGYAAISISKYVDPLGRYLDHYIQEEILHRSSSLDQSLYGLSFVIGLNTANQVDRSQIRLSISDREKRTDVFGFWYNQQMESSSIYDWEHTTLTFKVFEGIFGSQRSKLDWLNYDSIPRIYSPMHSMYSSSVTLAKLAQNLALSNSSFLSQASVERMRTSRFHGYDATSFEDLHITAGGFRLGSERYQIPNGTFASVSLYGSVVLIDPDNGMSMAYLSGKLAPEGESISALTLKARDLINTAVGIEPPTVPETTQVTENTTPTESNEPVTTGAATTGVVTTGVATTGSTPPVIPCTEDWECTAQPHAFCNVDDLCECHYGFEGDGNNCTCPSENIAWEGPIGSQQPYCLDQGECTQPWQCISAACNISNGNVVGTCA